MNVTPIDKCSSFINSLSSRPDGDPGRPLPVITISRETGAGAVTIAHLVSDILRDRFRDRKQEWAVFDKNLIQTVLDRHELKTSLEKYMPEDIRPLVPDTVEEILGLHPSSWTLNEYTRQTILELAMAGGTIIVGRGGHIVTRHLKHALHVRLVSPLEKRIRHIQSFYKIDRNAAVEMVRRKDKGRERYISEVFQSRIADPLAYHMTLNTGSLGFDCSAEIIAAAAQELIKKANTP
ncbi:MAG: AAA family ATPase [Terrimicrobiaceae bacterium]